MKEPKYIVSYSKYIAGSKKRMQKPEYETADSIDDATEWSKTISKEQDIVPESILIVKNPHYKEDNDTIFKKALRR